MSGGQTTEMTTLSSRVDLSGASRRCRGHASETGTRADWPSNALPLPTRRPRGANQHTLIQSSDIRHRTSRLTFIYHQHARSFTRYHTDHALLVALILPGPQRRIRLRPCPRSRIRWSLILPIILPSYPHPPSKSYRSNSRPTNYHHRRLCICRRDCNPVAFPYPQVLALRLQAPHRWHARILPCLCGLDHGCKD